jgi:hypothetical protein
MAAADALPGRPLSDEVEFVRLDALSIASPAFKDRELVLGLLVPWSSKHDVQAIGRPSVTIKGVGP